MEVLPGGKIAKPVSKLANSGGKYLVRIGNETFQATFRAFSSSNFRHNLKLLTCLDPSDAQAHHIFPQAERFGTFFKQAGVDVHDLVYGTWWETTAHQANSTVWNNA